MGTLADDVARPSLPTLAARYRSAAPNTPSSDPHCPRGSCHGCSPPGVALARSRITVVLPLFVAGAMEADPFIWTAPARSAGVARLACQREFRFSSLVVTWTAE